MATDDDYAIRRSKKAIKKFNRKIQYLKLKKLVWWFTQDSKDELDSKIELLKLKRQIRQNELQELMERNRFRG